MCLISTNNPIGHNKGTVTTNSINAKEKTIITMYLYTKTYLTIQIDKL